MAYMTPETCIECTAHFNSVNGKRVCGDCENQEYLNKKKKFLDEFRKDLTIEQRVEKIEEWLFDAKDHKHFSIRDAIF